MSQRNNQFYYHTDHLGSATLVTDDAADVVQQIAYLPYGEDWVDIRHHGYFGLACRTMWHRSVRLDTIAIIGIYT